MKVGDKVIAIRTFGEFETNFEGIIDSFYDKNNVIVKTKSGHNWVFKKDDIRSIEKNQESWCQ
tara:strand:+ start:799 stop:987 length:189 start_codon:yes stop_codon:yes gene_type:complete